MTVQLAVVIAVVLATMAYQWRTQIVAWRRGGQPLSTRTTVTAATSAGILLSVPLAGALASMVGWATRLLGVDTTAWLSGIGGIIAALAATGAYWDLARGIVRQMRAYRPLIHHPAAGLVLPAVLVAALGNVPGAASDVGLAIGGTEFTCTAPGQGIGGYGPDRLRNAAVIVKVGQDLGVPERGQVVAVATAMQESTLDNLNHGDRDSRGLFQQRPSQGWGTPAQVTDPVYAATQFYERLLAVSGWEQMPLAKAAQIVQRSAYPDAYAKHEALARQIVATTTGRCRQA